MAIVKSGTFGSSPSASYELHAEQTSGSGNSRTVKVTLRLKVYGSTSQSKYGFPLYWKARVKDSYSGWQTVKGSEYWYATEGYREFAQWLTVDVGTTSSTSITVGFQLNRSDGGSSSWNQTITGSFTVNKTNTAPYFPNDQKWINVRSGSTSSGTLLSGVIPENTSQVYISWGAASDAEGDSLTYALNHKINNGNWVQIDLGTDRAHSYSIGAGNEGQTIQYYVDVKDPSGAWSEKIYSAVLTKNTLIGGWFTNHSTDIYYGTDSFTIYFTGGRNTNNSPVYYYIYSDDIPIQNGREVTGESEIIKIWDETGTAPSTPYFKLSDIKNWVKNNNYNRRMHVGIRTRNDYNTYKWSGGSINIDLRTNPYQSSCYISDNSPAYKTVNGTKYLLPEGGQNINLDFKAASGKNGEDIYYEIYYSINDQNWIYLRNGYDATWKSTSNETWHTIYHNLGKMNYSGNIKYLVRVKTTYDYYSDSYTEARTFHYYHGISLISSKINRTQSSAEVAIIAKTSTSLPNVTTKGTWSCNGKSGNLEASQSEQIIRVSLSNENQQTLSITYNDNTGLSSDQTTKIKIPAFAPIFFVNRYGAGVGGVKANSNASFIVSGRASFETLGQYAGTVTNFDTTLTEGEYIISGTNLTGAPYTGNIYGKLIVKVNDGGTHNNQNNWIWQILYCTESTLVYKRSKTNANKWTAWCQEYNSINKPSPSDIGALSLSGGTLTGKLQIRNADANTHNSTYLELYRANGIRGSLITSHDSGLGIRLHTYNAEGNWSFNYVFNTDGTFEAGKLKMGNAFLSQDTLRLEKGYGGNYSQIFFKGQTNDDGRIIHWEDNNSSQLWIMPSDDINSSNDEVILGTIANKNGTTDLNGAAWNRAFSFKMDGTMVINSKSSHTDLNVLYHESNCLTSDTAPNRPENYCYIRTFGVNDGYTLQLASYYGSAGRYYIRSQQDTSKSWKVWESIITSDHRNIYKLRAAGNYMHIETSNGAKGINWWESDIKFKNNIQIIDSSNKENRSLDSEIPGLDLVNKIKHYSFDYDETHNNTHIDCGYIAQQLEEIDERLIIKIKQPKDSIYYSEEDKYTRQPNANVIIPYLSKAIQELYVKNIELENRLKDIENSNIDLK